MAFNGFFGMTLCYIVVCIVVESEKVEAYFFFGKYCDIEFVPVFC